MNKFVKYLPYLVLIVLVYQPVFGHLDVLPIRVWDESRLAINAYEMYQNGNWLTTHFEGKPDMWNTKPPLLIWFQSRLMYLIGVNELAIRLPSAIAVFLTLGILLFFCTRYLKDFWFGFITVIVLVTSKGYVSNTHVSRTGDYDTLLVFFTTLAAILFFILIRHYKEKYIYCFFAALTLAVLTKSVSGLLFLPGYVIYAGCHKRIIKFLKDKSFYVGAVGFLLVVGTYYLGRESVNPGYLSAVMNNELGGRLLEVIEGHQHSAWFYFDNIIKHHWSEWWFLLPTGFVAGIYSKNKKIVELTWYTTILILVYFSIITIAQTKLPWYDAPLYPFLAIQVSVFLYLIFNMIKKNEYLNTELRFNVMPYVFLFLVFLTPYQRIIDQTYKPTEQEFYAEQFNLSYLLQSAVRGKADLNNYKIAHHGYHAHLLFYTNILRDQGVNITFSGWKNLKPGAKVIFHQEQIKKEIDSKYHYTVLSQKDNVIFCEINF